MQAGLTAPVDRARHRVLALLSLLPQAILTHSFDRLAAGEADVNPISLEYRGPRGIRPPVVRAIPQYGAGYTPRTQWIHRRRFNLRG